MKTLRQDSRLAQPSRICQWHRCKSRKTKVLHPSSSMGPCWESFKTSPDPEIGASDSDLRDLRADTHDMHLRKTVDLPILIPKSQDSPRTVSTGATPPKNLKT